MYNFTNQRRRAARTGGGTDSFGTDLQPSLKKAYYHHLMTVSNSNDPSETKVQLSSPKLEVGILEKPDYS